jgi:hypothetical protein
MPIVSRDGRTFVYAPHGFAHVYVAFPAANERMCPPCLRRWRSAFGNQPRWPAIPDPGPQHCATCGTDKPKEGW